MKKRTLTFLCMFAMLFALVLSASAGQVDTTNFQDEVEVSASIWVQKSGSDTTWTNPKKTITLSTSEMTEALDFRASLSTATIKQTIKQWYEGAKTQIDRIATPGSSLNNQLTGYFNDFPVTGEFTVVIEFPDQFTFSDSKHLDSATTQTDNMYGFKELFYEKSRKLDNIDGNTSTLTIVIGIKDFFDDQREGISEQELYDGVTTVVDGNTGYTRFLNELTYTIEGVVPGTFDGSLAVTGKMEKSKNTNYTTMQIGKTDEPSDKVYFFTKAAASASLIEESSYPSGGTVSSTYKITFNIDGNTDEIDPMYAKGTVKASKLPTPVKPGYTFDGWYTDSAMTKAVGDDLSVTKNITLYGHWVSNTLITEEHFAYIIGYPDETVLPERNITREEAATMFYRLLRDDVRENIFTTENDFSDIATERWSNNAISTMANGGYVVGRTDGTFDPEAPITRAEFATMAVRFGSLMDTSGASFSDISGHWAETYILKAATASWVTGRPDGTFDPDAYITRAEAMTLVNNVLSRHVNKEGLHANTRIWIDMTGDEWYYYIVLEATNSHDYVRQEDGYNETWTEILPNKEWK